MKKIILWILIVVLAATAMSDIVLRGYNCFFEDMEMRHEHLVLYANNNYLFKLDESTDGKKLNIYSISDLDNIQLVSRIDISDHFYIHNKYRTFGNYVLIDDLSYGNSYVLDMSDESDIHLTDFGYDFKYRDFYVDEPYVYAAVDSDGVAIFDFNTMELISSSEYPFPVKEVSVYDTLLFATMETPGSDNIIISNNSDIYNPIMLSSVSNFTNVHKFNDMFYVSDGVIKGNKFQSNLIYKNLDLSELPRVTTTNISSYPVYHVDADFIHIYDEYEVECGGGTASGPEYETHSESITFSNDLDHERIFISDEDQFSYAKNGYFFNVGYRLFEVYKIEEDTLIRVANSFRNYYILNDNYIFLYSIDSPNWIAYELNIGDTITPDDTTTTPTPPDTVVVYVTSPDISIQSESPFQTEIDIQVDYANYVSITDISGRIVMEFEFDSSRNTVTWTPDEDIPTGAYLITARKGKVFRTKMVVYLKR